MTRQWLLDTSERTGATFVEAFCGALLAAMAIGHTLDLGIAKTAAIAGLSAAVAVLKAAVAAMIGDPASASLLPRRGVHRRDSQNVSYTPVLAGPAVTVSGRNEPILRHPATPTAQVATNIHAHPTRKLGRRPPKNAPALMLGHFLTGQVPAHPVTSDHLGKITFGLYGNDKYGDCGPTSVANLRRLVTAGLTGTMQAPSQDDVFDLYRRSGNPNFNPATDADDNGVDMQTMLEALLAGGIGGVKPLAFAKVDVSNDVELQAAVSIFGGVLWGVDLEVAQQAQTDAGTWDYKKSGVWGGHAILDGAYEADDDQDVITWAERIKTTAAFRQHQLQEAWVVIWQENVDHPAFQAGVDLTALAADYQELTGQPFPGVTPAPTPDPVPIPGPGPSPTPTPVPAPTPDPVGTITLTPPADVLAKVTARAAKKGESVEAYVEHALEQYIR